VPVLASLAVNLTISSNLLMALGIPYDAPGGSWLVKLHPASWLALLSGVLLLARDRQPVTTVRRLLAAEAATCAFLALMAVCVLFTAVATGSDNAVVFLDTFMPAGVLALVASQAGPRARRRCGLLVLGLLAGNALLCLGETLAGRHLLTVYLADQPLIEPPGEFRGTALYDHPLTGATLTAMGVFMLPATRLARAVRAGLLALFLVGLLGFGERTALAATLGTLALRGGLRCVARLRSGRLRGRDLAAGVTAALAIAGLIGGLLAWTSIGERIRLRAYWDASAATRSVEWQALGLLDIREALFGVGYARLAALAAQLDLRVAFGGFETLWLLMFLHLGAFGGVFFLIGFGTLLIGLWRRSAATGRMMLVVVIAVASASNSLARKSDILSVLVPCLYAVMPDPRRGFRLPVR